MSETKKALSLNLEDQGQMFAGVATIRAAIADVIDCGDDNQEPWKFYEDKESDIEGRAYEWTEDNANAERVEFMDAVIQRLAVLQAMPHSGVKLENLCDKHKREVLPRPTVQECVRCEAERRATR